MQYGFRPAAARRRQLKYGTGIAVRSAITAGSPVDVSGTIEDQSILVARKRAVATTLETVQHLFLPGAVRCRANGGLRKYPEHRAVAVAAGIGYAVELAIGTPDNAGIGSTAVRASEELVKRLQNPTGTAMFQLEHRSIVTDAATVGGAVEIAANNNWTRPGKCAARYGGEHMEHVQGLRLARRIDGREYAKQGNRKRGYPNAAAEDGRCRLCSAHRESLLFRRCKLSYDAQIWPARYTRLGSFRQCKILRYAGN